MRIVLNLLAVRSGGGQQVASGLVSEINRRSIGDSVLVITGQSTFLHHQCKKLGLAFVALPFGYIYRAFGFNRDLRRICSSFMPDVIYAFTPTPKVAGVPVVLRTVYSNIYFPEVNFWADLPMPKRAKKHAIDFFRKRGTFSADGLVFENKAMLNRSVDFFKFPSDRAKFIAPSISSHLEGFDVCRLAPASDKGFKILLLTSWHGNKNLGILPHVARCLQDSGMRCTFLISLRPEEAASVYSASQEMGVSHAFEFIGTVDPNNVAEIVQKSSAMMLLSKLECFSSNIVEAWHFERPLFCADEPWSRAACGEAAFFVNRDSPSHIAETILSVSSDQTKYRDMVEAGRKALGGLNTPASKFDEQWTFLEHIASLGPR